MSHRTWSRSWLWGAMVPVVGAALALAGCGGGPVTAENSGLRPADAGQPAAPSGEAAPMTPQPLGSPDAAPEQPPAIRVGGAPMGQPDPAPSGEETTTRPPPAPDLSKVPDGTPAELAKYISAIDDRFMAIVERLQNEGEEAVDPREILALKQAQIDAAEKILAAPEAGEYRAMAVNVKIKSLQLLGKFGNAPATLAARQFAESLIDDKDPAVAEAARLALFLSRVQEVSDKVNALYESAGDEGDRPALPAELAAEVEKVGAETQKLLADPAAGDDSFFAAFEAFNVLLATQRIPDAQATLKLMAEKYGQSKNGRIAFEVKQLQEKMLWILLIAGIEGDRTYIPEAAAKLEAGLADRSLKIQELQQALYILEVGGHFEELRKLVGLTRTAYEDYPAPKVAAEVSRMCGKIETRLDLIGKPFPIEGVLAEGGAAFDWKPYEGKVVLIDFWATWCGPCLAEMPNIHRNYLKYRERGFEVVGINLDEEVDALDRFRTGNLAKVLPGAASIPWATVIQGDPANAGRKNDPNAIRAGVEGIPCLILIGRDGNVLTLQTRGKRLDNVLATLFPEQPSADPAAPKTSEAAPGENKTGALALADSTTFVAFADEPAPPAPANGTVLDLEAINPYSPGPDLTVPELAEFILIMQEKPRTIQMRPGFRAAIVEAAERIVAAKAEGKPLEIARTAQFLYLHRDAALGDEKADADLAALAEQCQGDKNPKVARYVALVTIEREALAADKLEAEKLPELLARIKAFCAAEKLTGEHLRLASATVGVINLLPVAEREARFEEFGNLFATSKDKQLARYGKKIATKPEQGGGQSDLVGKPLELRGQAFDGSDFKWDTFRGKFVVVDFWATWCGPCRAAMPKMIALHGKHQGKGVEVIGVSLDEDTDALAEYLEENPLPWMTLNGDESSDVAKKYGVRGIPTIMLVDREGKIVAVSHSVAEIEAALDKALTAPVAAPAAPEKKG